jgi:hypothetical protein
MPQVITFLAWVGQGSVVLGAIKVALVIASVAYSRQQSKKMKKALKRLGDMGAEAQDRSFTHKDPAGPRRMIYGECRVGGNIIFIHVNGTKNEYLHLVVAMAAHEVTSFSNLQLDDEVVSIDGSGAATGRFAGHLDAHFFLGSPSQTSNAALQANCPEVWTSDHRLRGTAGVYIRLKYNTNLFPNGIPNITALCRGKKCFDPRSALTSWTNNAALILADYLTEEQQIGGMGFDYDTEIDEAELIASANNCDELVELDDTSTEKRYTISGMITGDTVYQDVVDDMVEAMGGKCTYVSGQWKIMSGYYRTPTMTFDEGSLAGGISMSTKVSRSENFNAAKGTFISPLNYWQAADFPPVTNSTYQTQDGNVRIFRDFAFPFTTSSATCQRLAKIQLEKVRQAITIRTRGNLSWLRVQCGDVIGFTNTRFGFSAKPFEVADLEIVTDSDSGIVVDVVLRETASGVFTWANGEETVVDLAPDTNLPSPFNIQPPTAIVVTSDGTTTETEGSESINRMLVEWTAPADQVVISGGYIRIEYRPFDATEWRDWGLLAGNRTSEYVYPVLQGVAYVVRMRSENRGLGLVSAWVYSEPTEATGDTTAPAAPTSFTATGGIGGVYLEWTNPADSDFDHTDIYWHTASTPAPDGSSIPNANHPGDATPPDEYFRSGMTGGDTAWFWIRAVDTSGNKSAWVGPQGATVAAELSAVSSPGYASASAPPNATAFSLTSSAETCVITGGIPTFTYLWEIVSGSIMINSPTSATTDFTADFGSTAYPSGFVGESNQTAVVRCKVTDSSSSIVYTQDVTVSITMLEWDPT